MSGNDKGPNWTGTWLTGARTAGADLGYPGERLGFPKRGSGSAASYARRLVALLIDWFASMLVAGWISGVLGWSDQAGVWLNLGVFLLQAWIGVAFVGTTLGKRIAGLRVVRLDGRPVGPLWGAARALLLGLMVPALLWDRDHRGLHDRAANTAVIEY
ncbi:RDD family protein [Actinocorallia sp. A-T 12471]|uniref:RDD family protein n=1 Tax=Actinocorallia sp. A-T 12471 TaxID=3089813 RepID=UPI0029D0E741|nr:RDD family protein [Actinocorallia sp. A-T 12471]MDX6743231.1 RDD family protein [Actinocorallia sp. A-T 12471]